MNLGDVQAPTPLQRRSTLILDDGHEDEETIVHHHNDDQHLLVPYHSQNDSDDDDFESANEVYSSEHFESATDDDHDSNGNDSIDNPNSYNESWAIFHPALNNKNTARITDNINLTLNETIAPNNAHADDDDSGWHDMHSQWRKASIMLHQEAKTAHPNRYKRISMQPRRADPIMKALIMTTWMKQPT